MTDTLSGRLYPPVLGGRWGRATDDPGAARRRHLLGLLYEDPATADALDRR